MADPVPAERGVALVTGAARGIGRAIALGLATAEWDVAVNTGPDAVAAADLVDTVTATGRRSVAVRVDVSDPAAAARLVAETTDRLGLIEVLVNNVGEFAFAPLATTTPEEWRRRSRATWAAPSTPAWPRCRACGSAAAGSATCPAWPAWSAPNVAAYVVAKTGVVVLTMTMAVEEAPYGITVNRAPRPGGHRAPAAGAGRLDGRAGADGTARPGRGDRRRGALPGVGAGLVRLRANLAVAGGWDWLTRPTDHDMGVTGLFLGDRSG